MKISIKAICAGLAVGLVGSTLSSIVVAAAFGVSLTPNALENELSNHTLLIVDLLFSLLFVFLGGYVAAKIAKANPKPSVITMAVIQLALIALTTLPKISALPWYTAITLLAPLPVAFWGARIARSAKV